MDHGSATIWTPGKRDIIEQALGAGPGEEVGLSLSDNTWNAFLDAAIRNLTGASIRALRLPAPPRPGHG
jgi:hypothetical protein